MLQFENLSSQNIDAATGLTHSVFPEEALGAKSPGNAYKASLEPEKYSDFYNEDAYKVTALDYYVAREQEGGEIIGVTGLYQKSIDPEDMAWLGWYCVDPRFRGKGYGQEILEWTIEKAKEKGFTVLRLWTSDDPGEAAAQSLYGKLGFTIYKTEDSPAGYRILYREKALSS